MSEAIVVACITGGLAVIGQIIVSAKSTSDLYAKLDKQSEVADERLRGDIAVIKAEIANLRQTVEKHNHVVERTYDLEKKIAKHDEQIKTLFNK